MNSSGGDEEDLDELETISSGDTTSCEEDTLEMKNNNYGLQKMPSYEFKFAKSNAKLMHFAAMAEPSL